MRNHGIMRSLALLAMAVALATTPAPASAATKQVWQGGDWAVEATPYWCRAYPVAAKKNADGIPAVALIQWDGKVYLEFGLPQVSETATRQPSATVNIDGNVSNFWSVTQPIDTQWGAIIIDDAKVQDIRRGHNLSVETTYTRFAGYSLKGSNAAVSTLEDCAARLVGKGKAGKDPLLRVKPNQRLKPRGSPGSWFPADGTYPRQGRCGNEICEGSVAFRLTVDTDGRPINCEVIEVKGHAELGPFACTNMMKRAKFMPATDAFGYAVQSQYSNRVRWEIPSDSASFEPLGAFPNITFDDKSRSPIPKGNPGNWAPPSAYPRGPDMNFEGTVGFTLTVGPDGRPTACKITSSSGNSELDAATCSTLMKRAKFEPALDVEGKPIESEYSNKVRWEYPR